MAFKIIKRSSADFWHNNGFKEVNLSDWEIILESIGNTVVLEAKNGANFPQKAVGILDVIVIDETASSVEETFTNVEDLRLRLVTLGYNPYIVGTGGIQSIVAGTNVTVDDTDPQNPIVSASGGGGSTPNLEEVLTEGNTATDKSIILQISTVDRYTEYSDNGVLIANSDTSNEVQITDSYVQVAQSANGMGIYADRIQQDDGTGSYRIKFRPNTNLGGDFYFKDPTGVDEDIAFVSDIEEAVSGYIPLSGTETGSPLAGEYEMGIIEDGVFFKNTNTNILTKFGFTDGGGFVINTENLISGVLSAFKSQNDGFLIDCDDPLSQGLVGVHDYSANYTNFAYIQKIYLDAQLALKAAIASPTFTGTLTTPAIIVSSETASRLAIIDSSKNVKSADTATYPSLTELAFLKGVTSAIQTQITANANALALAASRTIHSNYTTITNVIVPTVAISLPIPAGAYGSTDAFEIIVTMSKSVTLTPVFFNLYHDTTVNGTGNTIASAVQLSAANRAGAFSRILNLSGGIAYNAQAATSTSMTAYVASSGVASATTYNPAVTQYITLQISGLTVLSESTDVTVTIRPLK